MPKVKCIGYNQHGEGMALFNNKVFYIPNFLINEEAEVKIISEQEKWGRAEIQEILITSKNRNHNVPKDYQIIGGYEIIHMNRQEQSFFKEQKIINDFKQNAQYNISINPILFGKNQLRYRNKITLHDGCFYQRNSHTPICLTDFLLTDIKPYTDKKGKIIIRKLDTLIIGKKHDKLWTTDTLFDLKIRVSIGAFYQVNKEMSNIAYQEILKFVEPSNIIFDLFSGIGTISLLLSKKAKQVIAVERNKISHQDALYNKTLNKINNVEFIACDVIKFLKLTKIKPDLVIVDPAREGLKKDICNSLLKLSPKRIIYLSCNPATQAADFNRLKEKYKIIYAQPIDMFPQTYHIENLLVLELL